MHVSILGDSISTYEGMNPPGYAVYFDEYGSAANGLRGVTDTWWSQVLDALGADILVNDAFSGSLVAGTRFPAGCSNTRTHNLAAEGMEPGLIIVYMGMNDFGYCAPVRPGSSTQSGDTRFFSEAYAKMLHEMRSLYPQATIVCGTIMRTSVLGYDGWSFPEMNQAGTPLKAYDEAIRAAAESQGALVVDLARCGETYESLDGTHPTVNGHRTMAEQWLRGLRALGIAPKE